MEKTTDPSSDHAKDFALPKSQICDHRHSFPEFNGDELFQLLEVERRVHAVTAAYHDCLPIVLVLLEDSALLPSFSEDQLHFEVHVFLGQYQWASGFDALSQVSFGGYLSPPRSALAQSSFTAGLFLQDKDHPSNRYILSVGHPFSSEFHSHVINDERKDIKIGWPDASLSLGHCDQYLKLANLRIPKLEAEMNLLHAQTLEFKGGNEHQQNLFHSRKKRYEFLAATIEIMKLDILEISNRKISSEKLRITPSDTEIGHVLVFIPQNFSSIEELRPGQKIVLDCMAVQRLRIGEIGSLESFFGLPDPGTTRNPTEIPEAKYFIHEYCVSKQCFAVPGASGSIVRTSAEGAAIGMVVGIFEGPGFELSIILPLKRLLDRVEKLDLS
ncbi:hypothetical protein EV359DRAFT_65658 [Lentinula novae-zelandiae]|nr:hypothetical protein EV359DRAFT_65658 [Lentinula novae-zelandiae]